MEPAFNKTGTIHKAHETLAKSVSAVAKTAICPDTCERKTYAVISMASGQKSKSISSLASLKWEARLVIA